MTDIESVTYPLRASPFFDEGKKSFRRFNVFNGESKPSYIQADNISGIHTYKSEWAESSELVSSKDTDEMIHTEGEAYDGLNSSGRRMETPSKSKGPDAYITPESELRQRFDSEGKRKRSNEAHHPKEKAKKPQVAFWDVIWQLMNDMTGKDKLGKICQYVLRLLLHHSKRVEAYLSDEKININSINQRYNDRVKQIALLKSFIQQPSNFFRTVSILFCSTFFKRFNGVAAGISIYRQFSRFGKTPFRIRSLTKKVNESIDENNSINFRLLLNSSNAAEALSLYYGISDETILLSKLGFVTDNRIRALADRHEIVSWFYQSVTAIYILYDQLQELGHQEMELKIQIQVKNKAKALSRQLLNGGSSPYLDYATSEGEDFKLLKDVQFRKQNIRLEVYKSFADFVFTFYPLFHIPLPFETLQIWMGISAATLSTIKLYREAKKKLLCGRFK